MCAKDTIEDEKSNGQTNANATDTGNDWISQDRNPLISFDAFDSIVRWSLT